MDKKERIAPCGLDCATCPAYRENVDEKTRAYLAGRFHIRPEEAACEGCLPSEGHPLPCPDCATYACAESRGVRFCSDCPDFPCRRLMPVADGAGRFPHNTKLYNLMRMRLLGLERWLEETEEDRKSYFTAKLVLGEGPVSLEGQEAAGSAKKTE